MTAEAIDVLDILLSEENEPVTDTRDVFEILLPEEFGQGSDKIVTAIAVDKVDDDDDEEIVDLSAEGEFVGSDEEEDEYEDDEKNNLIYIPKVMEDSSDFSVVSKKQDIAAIEVMPVVTPVVKKTETADSDIKAETRKLLRIQLPANMREVNVEMEVLDILYMSEIDVTMADVKNMQKEDFAIYTARENALVEIRNKVTKFIDDVPERIRYETATEAEQNVEVIATEIIDWITELGEIETSDDDLKIEIDTILNDTKNYEYNNSKILYELYLCKNNENAMNTAIDEYYNNKEELAEIAQMEIAQVNQKKKALAELNAIYTKNDTYKCYDEKILIAAGYEFIVRDNTNGFNNYIGFKTSNQRDLHVRRNGISNESLHEKINLTKEFVAFLEIDAECDNADKPRVEKQIKSIIAAYKAVLGTDNIIITKCPYERDGKLSCHLFPQNKKLTVANNKELLEFINKVKEIVDDDETNSYIDMNFTRDSAHYLKIPFFHKVDKTTGKLIKNSYQIPNIPLSSYCVQFVSGEWRQKQQNTKPIQTITPTPRQAIFLANMKKSFPQYNYEQLTGNERGIYLTRRIPSKCTARNCKITDHHRRGCVVRSIGNIIYAKCLKTEARKVGSIYYENAVEPKELGIYNKESLVTNPDSTDTVDKEIIEMNTNRVSEFVVNDGEDFAIKSTYGSGKTYFMGKEAKNWKKDGKKVLYVSSRCSLSGQIEKDTGFAHYQKVPRGEISIKKYKQLVIQIDSLERIQPDGKFDVVVVDEVTQLVNHVYDFNNTNHKAQIAMSQLRGYIQECGQLILLDNDLTSYEIDTFMSLRPDHSCKIYVNKFSRWSHIAPKIHLESCSFSKLRVQLMNTIQTQAELKKQGLTYGKIVVACHSKSLVREIALQVKKVIPNGDDLVGEYTADTDDKVKSEHFQNASTHWHKKLVIVYSPTVSVGVSCSKPENEPNFCGFKYCYGFFDNSVIPSSTNVQMLTRCRDVENIEIAINMRPNNGVPTTINELLKWACCSQRNKLIPSYLRHDRTPGIAEKTATDPKAFQEKFGNTFEARLWIQSCINTYRSQVWPVQRLIRIMAEAGFAAPEVIEENNNVTVSDEVKEVHSICKQEVKEEIAKVMAENVKEAVERHMETEDKSIPLTEQQKLGNDAYYILQRYGMQETITEPEWFLHYGKSSVQEANRRKAVTAEIMQKLGKVAPVDDKISVSSTTEANNLTMNVFEVLGVSANTEGRTVDTINVADRKRTPNIYTQFVSDTDLMSNNTMKQVKILSDNAKRIYGYTRYGKDLKIMADRVSVINIALNHFGATLKEFKSDYQMKGHKYVLVWNKYSSKCATPVPSHVVGRPEIHKLYSSLTHEPIC